MDDMDRNALAALIEAVEGGTWVQDAALAAFPIIDYDNSESEPGVLVQRAHRGSLDAAKALHEALLPGWSCAMNTNGSAQVIGPLGERFHGESENNPARAWLLAILRDLAAEGGE